METDRPFALHWALCALLLGSISGCAPERAPGVITDAGFCAGARCRDGLGRACTRNNDCADSICVPIGEGRNVCSESCTKEQDCFAGWQCTSEVCRCTPAAEVCDGLDNDCNGVIDDTSAANSWCVTQLGERHTCVEGACVNRVCSNNGGCLFDEICNRATKRCERKDGGVEVPEDGGSPSDAGPPDAGTRDAGPPGCTSRCDCPSGSACSGGTCVSVTRGGSCSRDDHCGRGQVCYFDHRCYDGCTGSCDCQAPAQCSTTEFVCERCSSSNPCPSGQFCAGAGAEAECVTSLPCGASSDYCNTASAGTVCIGGLCEACSSDSQCRTVPYGAGYVCSAGKCQAGCASCNATCTSQGASCNTVACQCNWPSCTDENCNGIMCTGTQVCGSNCTCVTAGASSDCARTGCTGGRTCVSSSISQAVSGCGNGSGTCTLDCALGSCPDGWTCVDLNRSFCSEHGLTAGRYCLKGCATRSDCPGSQDCCQTTQGLNLCSPVGSCLSL